MPAEHRLELPQGQLCWFEWGTPSDRPSLLLLHATGFHARVWDATIAALPDDLHIVAPDLRGHGRSFRPERIDDWQLLADDLVGLVEQAFDGPLVGVGHSMGGVTLVRLAAVMPGRFARLLLVDPVIATADFYAHPLPGGAQDHPIARRRGRWESPDAMIAAFAARAPYSQWVPQVLEEYCRHGLLPQEDGGYALACPPLLEASIYASAAHNDPAAAVAAVTCPVTVLRARSGERSGKLDFSVSPTDPALASRFREGRDLHWPDVSHFIPMEVPDRLAALIAQEIDAAT